MNEIKHRAYNDMHEEGDKKMMYDVWITPKGEVIMEDGEFYNFPLMRYTGLKDKIGKEIYEGDIIIDNIGDRKWEVKWHDGGFTYQHYATKKHFDGRIGPVITRCQKYLMEMCEVIGNIYENPELLKQTS